MNTVQCSQYATATVCAEYSVNTVQDKHFMPCAHRAQHSVCNVMQCKAGCRGHSAQTVPSPTIESLLAAGRPTQPNIAQTFIPTTALCFKTDNRLHSGGLQLLTVTLLSLRTEAGEK